MELVGGFVVMAGGLRGGFHEMLLSGLALLGLRMELLAA